MSSARSRLEAHISKSQLFVRAIGMFLACIAWTPAAQAKRLPPLEELMTAKEKALITPERVERLDTAIKNKNGGTPVIDEMLALDREPTPFRGLLQMMRATFLMSAGRSAEAELAVDEAIRLLPDFGEPLSVGVEVYTYSDKPEVAADYLLRLAAVEPAQALTIPDYGLWALLRRLAGQRDRKREEAVSDRMLEIGWRGAAVDSRSRLASKAIGRRLAEGRVDEARAIIPELLVPSDTYALLVDKRYTPIWPDLERWGGDKLSHQWQMYLSEAKSRFAVNKSGESILDYARALDEAGDDVGLTNEILPLLMRDLDATEDNADLVFVASPVGDALARVGRWSDLHRMYEHLEKVWPLSSEDANALNLYGNHARHLLEEGRPAEALALMDKTIGRFREFGVSVNSDALSTMYSYRSCMLYELGRERESSEALMLSKAGVGLDDRVAAQLCRGDIRSARQQVLTSLENEATRSTTLVALQKSSGKPCPSAFCLRMGRRDEKVRSDPAVIAAIRKYGRLLPYAVNEGAAPMNRSPTPEQSGRVPLT